MITPTIETVDLPVEDMRRLAAANDVIERLGLQLICPKCTALYGYGSDCVVGDNVQGSDTLTLRCGCTIRRSAARRS
jgi:hypothetical protein